MECLFIEIKDYRRVAMRFEKLARRFLDIFFRPTLSSLRNNSALDTLVTHSNAERAKRVQGKPGVTTFRRYGRFLNKM